MACNRISVWMLHFLALLAVNVDSASLYRRAANPHPVWEHDRALKPCVYCMISAFTSSVASQLLQRLPPSSEFAKHVKNFLKSA